MRRDARAGGLAEVQAHVEARRAHHLLQHGLTADEQVHHLGALRGGEFGQFADLAVRQHHQMAGIVRRIIEDDEAVRAAVQDQIGLVIIARKQGRERAAGAGLLAGADVLDAPVRVELFGHRVRRRSPWAGRGANGMPSGRCCRAYHSAGPSRVRDGPWRHRHRARADRPRGAERTHAGPAGQGCD